MRQVHDYRYANRDRVFRKLLNHPRNEPTRVRMDPLRVDPFTAQDGLLDAFSLSLLL